MAPRVKDIIISYKRGNINEVYAYLTQSGMEVDPSTWAGNIKRMIENKQYISVGANIELVAYKMLNYLKL